MHRELRNRNCQKDAFRALSSILPQYSGDVGAVHVG